MNYRNTISQSSKFDKLHSVFEHTDSTTSLSAQNHGRLAVGSNKGGAHALCVSKTGIL